MKSKADKATLEQIGLQSLLPGMVWLHDLIGREIERIQALMTDNVSATSDSKGYPASLYAPPDVMRDVIEAATPKRKYTKRKPKRKLPPPPERINGLLTKFGLARELGIHPVTLDTFVRSHKIPTKNVAYPGKGGSKLTVYTEAAVTKIKKLRAESPTVRRRLAAVAAPVAPEAAA